MGAGDRRQLFVVVHPVQVFRRCDHCCLDWGLYRDSARARRSSTIPGSSFLWCWRVGSRLNEHHVDASISRCRSRRPTGCRPTALGQLLRWTLPIYGARAGANLGAWLSNISPRPSGSPRRPGLADHFVFQSSTGNVLLRGEQRRTCFFRSTYVVPQLAMELEMSDGLVRILID